MIKINTKGLDFKHKEVISIKDARRLGFVQDVNADLETGIITSIIVPGNSRYIYTYDKDQQLLTIYNTEPTKENKSNNSYQ